jgi:hypothetical protein
MQNNTTARPIHIMVTELITNPNFPSENGEFATSFLPRSNEMRIGIAYEVLKHIVATPVNELKAAELE